MATDPPPDLVLTPLNGEPRGIDDWVTLFPLALVVLDPYTYESAWLLEEAGRILTSFTAADIRVGWLATSTADEAREFLGPWADKLLTFVDPEPRSREGARPRDPARVRRRQHGDKIEAVAEGWDPPAWRAAVHQLADVPRLVGTGDPRAGRPSPLSGVERWLGSTQPPLVMASTSRARSSSSSVISLRSSTISRIDCPSSRDSLMTSAAFS